MFWYKKLDEFGKVVSLFCYRRPPKSLPDGYVEISLTEYELALSEILASEPQPSNKPTYDELLEAYNILTGGNDNE